MIDRLTQSANAASNDFRLPRQAHQERPQASVFGEIYEHNAAQYATLEAATALADLLGGEVVNVSENWGGGAKSPEYNIEFSAGKRLNAGLLAERFAKYGTQVALKMTQAEVGASLGIDYFPPHLDPAASTNLAQPQPAAGSGAAASPATNTGNASNNPDLRAAAVQFEALVLTQLIRAAKESGNGGWLNADGGDESGNAVMEMAEEYLSQALSSTGGLGLADVITGALRNNPPPRSDVK